MIYIYKYACIRNNSKEYVEEENILKGLFPSIPPFRRSTAVSQTSSLGQWQMKWTWARGLVCIFATCKEDSTQLGNLLQAWKIGFVVRWSAKMLYENNKASRYWRIPMSQRRNEIQVSLAAAIARAQCSISVDDRATVGCFLAVHEIQFEPRIVQVPEVDRWLSSHPTQSASTKPNSCKEPRDKIRRPRSRVPQTNLKTSLTIWEWATAGACIYRQIILTAKERSGLVKVRYWGVSTRLQKWDGSWYGWPAYLSGGCLIGMGVGIGLQFSIETRARISIAYFCWDSRRPAETSYVENFSLRSCISLSISSEELPVDTVSSA